MIAVVIILGRIIWGTPLVTRVRETFASGSASRMINSLTECPAGGQMYMYNGSPYCCSGTIDPSADRALDTCKPSSGRDAQLTFCTLGPSSNGVANCLETRSGLMQAEGEAICPKATPTFVQGAAGGRCCADPGNPALTECYDPKSKSCDSVADPNVFKTPSSCQFLKAQEDAPACPTNYGPFTAAGQGAMASLTLFGCTDNGQNCYADSTIKRLKELGYDVSGLTSCKV